MTPANPDPIVPADPPKPYFPPPVPAVKPSKPATAPTDVFVGQIVLVVNDIGPERNLIPAIVTRVRGNGELNLRVFYDNGNAAGHFLSAAHWDGGEVLKAGTWRTAEDSKV